MSTEKIVTMDQKDLDTVKKIKNEYNQLAFNLGQLEFEIDRFLTITNSLKKEKEELLDQRKKLYVGEEQLVDDFKKKYGPGQIDLEKGIYIKD